MRLPKPESAGLTWADTRAANEGELMTHGLACSIFEDAGFEPNDHLIPWQGTEHTLVDRYDARLHLESLKWVPSREEQILLEKIIDEATTEELDEERYLDMASMDEAQLMQLAGWFDPQHHMHGEAAETVGTGANSVPLGKPNPSLASSLPPLTFAPSYGDSEPSQVQQRVVSDETRAVQKAGNSGSESIPPAVTPFRPDFQIPAGLAHPETLEMHKIIRQAAKFVRETGQQSIFILRVKQSHNPKFAFLMPQNPMNPYFEWMIKDGLDVEAETSGTGARQKDAYGRQTPEKDAGDGIDNASEGALGLLTAYGSDTPKSGSQNTSFSSQNLSSEDDPNTALPSDSKPPATFSADQPLDPDIATHANMQPMMLEVPKAAIAVDSKAGAEKIDNIKGGYKQPDKAEAILEPSQNVKLIIQKLMQFVQKRGAIFETSLRQKEAANPKFAFLQPGDTYHPYYRKQLAGVLGEAEVTQLLGASAHSEDHAPRDTVSLSTGKRLASHPAVQAAKSEAGSLPSALPRILPRVESAQANNFSNQPEQSSKLALLPPEPESLGRIQPSADSQNLSQPAEMTSLPAEAHDTHSNRSLEQTPAEMVTVAGRLGRTDPDVRGLQIKRKAVEITGAHPDWGPVSEEDDDSYLHPDLFQAVSERSKKEVLAFSVPVQSVKPALNTQRKAVNQAALAVFAADGSDDDEASGDQVGNKAEQSKKVKRPARYFAVPRTQSEVEDAADLRAEQELLNSGFYASLERGKVDPVDSHHIMEKASDDLNDANLGDIGGLDVGHQRLVRAAQTSGSSAEDVSKEPASGISKRSSGAGLSNNQGPENSHAPLGSASATGALKEGDHSYSSKENLRSAPPEEPGKGHISKAGDSGRKANALAPSDELELLELENSGGQQTIIDFAPGDLEAERLEIERKQKRRELARKFLQAKAQETTEDMQKRESAMKAVLKQRRALLDEENGPSPSEDSEEEGEVSRFPLPAKELVSQSESLPRLDDLLSEKLNRAKASAPQTFPDKRSADYMKGWSVQTDEQRLHEDNKIKGSSAVDQPKNDLLARVQEGLKSISHTANTSPGQQAKDSQKKKAYPTGEKASESMSGPAPEHRKHAEDHYGNVKGRRSKERETGSSRRPDRSRLRSRTSSRKESKPHGVEKTESPRNNDKRGLESVELAAEQSTAIKKARLQDSSSYSENTSSGKDEESEEERSPRKYHLASRKRSSRKSSTEHREHSRSQAVRPKSSNIKEFGTDGQQSKNLKSTVDHAIQHGSSRSRRTESRSRQKSERQVLRSHKEKKRRSISSEDDLETQSEGFVDEEQLLARVRAMI